MPPVMQTPLRTLLRRLHHALALQAAGGLDDAQLVERWVERRDEAAFELLVWRHGTLVFNVCRRVLRQEQDVEDAFQATFLTLVRKAGSIGRRQSLGSWLYTVAHRIALRARAASARRAECEQRAAEAMPRAGAEVSWHALLRVLDEEVSRLPEKYRAPFVLCHLGGKTLEAAARELACPPGTVGTRLARARELVRQRLRRRDLALPAVGFVGSGVGGTASAPAALLQTPLQAATRVAAGKSAAGLVAGSVLSLTEGAVRKMILTRPKFAAVMLVALGLTGVAAGALSYWAVETPASTPAPDERMSEPVARPERALLRWKLTKGQAFYQTLETKLEVTQKLLGRQSTDSQNQTVQYRWTLDSAPTDADLHFRQKVEAIKVSMDSGGKRTEYDSTKRRNADNLYADLFKQFKQMVGFESNDDGVYADLYKQMVGFEFTVDLGARDHQVKRIEGKQAFVYQLAVANAAMVYVVNQVLSDEALREPAQSLFAVLPGREVQPGDKWTSESHWDLWPLGTWHFGYTYTYLGPDPRDPDVQLIGIRVGSKLTQAIPPREIGLRFRIADGQVQTTTGDGIIRFHSAKGQVESVNLTTRLAAEMTLETESPPTKIEFVLNRSTKVLVSTADPTSAR
jgi:RNA polymerase sigma factor (sigma-70 family)